jgi:mono/diheme cytochrome c family protein
MVGSRVRFAAALGALCAVGATAASQVPAVADGRRVYEREKCATCHQIAGKGNSRFPLDGVGRRLSRDQLRRWFTHTVEMEAALPRLPAIRMSSRKYKFSDADLEALVEYLASVR